LRPWRSAISDVNPHSGFVTALAVSRDGRTLYVGGPFDHLGSNLQPRASLGAVSTRTGKATAWNPGLGPSTASVQAIALAPGGGVVYVAGEFTTAGHNASPRSNVAAISAAAPGNATAWAPNPNGFVDALAIRPDGTVYLGGSFTTAGHKPQPRSDLAAISPTVPGNARPWHPTVLNADAVNGPRVYTLAFAPGGRSMIVGGLFTRLSGKPRVDLGELSLATGAAMSWSPHVAPYLSGVEVVALGGRTLRVGGSFDGLGRGDFHDYAQFTSR
jgi:hypothetical protein